MNRSYRLLRKGDRVRRGPDWHWGDQDCDSRLRPTTGTVAADQLRTREGDGWVTVRWDGGGTNCYEYEPTFRAIERVCTNPHGQLDLFEEV